MTRLFASFAIAAALLLSAPLAIAQEAKQTPAAKPAAPKIAKDEKTCRHRFPNGKSTTWVCKKEQPCCAWDAISYVKCGSTITGCL